MNQYKIYKVQGFLPNVQTQFINHVTDSDPGYMITDEDGLIDMMISEIIEESEVCHEYEDVAGIPENAKVFLHPESTTTFAIVPC